MINNDLLRRISKIFSLTDQQIISIFLLGQSHVTTEQLAHFYQEKDHADYQEISDLDFARFLNGLIIDKRGAKDGPQPAPQNELTNNIIFNKVKIALALKADEVIEILSLAGLTLGKYELSAFFRNVNHKHYKMCSDEVLSTFLKGLQIKFHG